VFKRIIAEIMFRINFNKTYTELSNLSARELRDIGIDRSMITRIALEHARKLT